MPSKQDQEPQDRTSTATAAKDGGVNTQQRPGQPRARHNVLRDALNSPWALSWQVLAVIALPRLLAEGLLASLQGHQRPPGEITAVWLLGTATAAVLLLGARGLARRRRATWPQWPYAAVAYVSAGGLFLVRAATFHQDSALPMETLLLAAALKTLLWTAAAVAVYGMAELHRDALPPLVAAGNRLLHADAAAHYWQARRDLLRHRLRTLHHAQHLIVNDLRGLSARTQAIACAQQVARLSSDLVRPLSHQLLEPPPGPPTPHVPRWPLLTWVWLLPAPWLPVTCWTGLNVLALVASGNIREAGIVAGVGASAVAGLIGVGRLGKRLAHRNTALAAIWLLAAVPLLATSYFASLAAGLAYAGSAPQVAVTWAATDLSALAIVLAAWTSTRLARAVAPEAQQALDRLADTAEAQAQEAEELCRTQEREAAERLHHRVQARLTAAALLLGQDSTGKHTPHQKLEQALRLIRVAADETLSTPQNATLASVQDKLARDWDGVLSVSLQTTNGTTPRTEVTRYVQSILDELCSNAVRHGGADEITIVIGSAGADLTIDAHDNGQVSANERRRGLGQRLVEHGGGTWRQERGSDGTRVHLKIPMAVAYPSVPT